MRHSPDPPPIYALADAAALAPMRLSEGAERLAAAGVRWIQLRAKDLPDDELYREVERSCERLEGSEVGLWINDRADLAALFPVAGLHVGQNDLAPVEARQVVGNERWVGTSTHSLKQLERAAADPQVDVVAIGPVFATTSKADAEPVVGLDLVRRARRRTDKPLVAIGGIGPETIDAVLAAGADSVALLGAVSSGDLGGDLAALSDWL